MRRPCSLVVYVDNVKLTARDERFFEHIDIMAALSRLAFSWRPAFAAPATNSNNTFLSKRWISLETKVAGITLPKAILNSPSPRATSLEDLRAIADSPATGAFTTRTACPNFVHDDAQHQWREWSDGNTINCLGYSCHPFEYYSNAIQTLHGEMKEKKDRSRSSLDFIKPAFFSISGYAHEIAEMLEQVASQFSENKNQILVEINLSCPNIPGKPPIAYDFEGMQKYLAIVFSKGNHGLKVGVKLTPYFHELDFVHSTQVLNSFSSELDFVTCINTVGCGLVIDIDTEAPVLADASASYGGLGGPAVHAIALGNVRRMRQLLDPTLDVIGCGGVDSGAAAFSHLLCGAQAVMVASALLIQGPSVFETIEAELKQIMVQKGYESIDDFRGKLQDGTVGNPCPSALSA